MVEQENRFLEALAFIYNKNNDLVTKTAITGYDPEEMSIEVSEGLESIEPKTRLQLLIIQSGGASEFKGILKEGFHDGKYTILIYDEHQRDVRASVRRTLNASAVISDMVTDQDAIAAAEPLPVIIENMSTTGILLASRDTSLEIGALLQVDLHMGNKIGVLYCEVLREQEQADGMMHYGCQLFFFDN